MIQKNNQSKRNLFAFAIGFFIIVLVAVLIFSKRYFLEKKPDVKIEETEDIPDEYKNPKNYSSINSQDLFKKIIGRENNFEIIDIRENVNFEIKHIIDSKNISVEGLNSIFSNLDKQKEYILVDDFGFTPSEIEALDLFLANGVKNIFYLEGGISAWENDLQPLVAMGDPYSITDQSKVTYIKSEELKKLLESEANLWHIIDLRENSNFSADHLAGAVNIPLDALEEKRRQIPSGKKIVLYDDEGLVAFQGAVRLFDMGTFNVFALSDGLNTWKQKGFAVVK